MWGEAAPSTMRSGVPRSPITWATSAWMGFTLATTRGTSASAAVVSTRDAASAASMGFSMDQALVENGGG